MNKYMALKFAYNYYLLEVFLNLKENAKSDISIYKKYLNKT